LQAFAETLMSKHYRFLYKSIKEMTKDE